MERKNRHRMCIFHHYGGAVPFEPWNPNFACVVGSTTESMVTNFIKIGQGVFELQGSENWGLPLTWLVALTTVQHYRADCDSIAILVLLKVRLHNATGCTTDTALDFWWRSLFGQIIIHYSLFGSKLGFSRILETLYGVHAFGYNSAESDPIWMKPGVLWVYCLRLALVDFLTRSAQ